MAGDVTALRAGAVGRPTGGRVSIRRDGSEVERHVDSRPLSGRPQRPYGRARDPPLADRPEELG